MKPYFKADKAMTVPFRRESEAQVFLGVRSICAYLHIGPSTFYAWARNFDLPATRTPDGRWMISTALIDDWMRARLVAMNADGSPSGRTEDK